MNAGGRSWRAVAGAIYVGVAALLVVNVLPALISIVAQGLKWDDRSLGLLAAADVAGIALGSLVGIPLVQRLSLMFCTFVGLTVLVAADLGCALGASQFQVVGFRFLGGVASGLILATCYTIYSWEHPQRNFALFSLGQMVSGFIGVTALPFVVARWGWSGSFVFLAAATALAMPMTAWLPVRSAQRTAAIAVSSKPSDSGLFLWLAVAGIVIYVTGAGAVWTFMARMGLAAGISEHGVNVAISGSEIAGVLGALATMFSSRRLGIFLPLTVCALFSAASICAMRTPNPQVYFLALSVFTFTWLAFATIQFAIIASADTRGVATIAMSTAWYAGFTVGPYVAGSLVDSYGFVPVQLLGAAGVIIALLTLVPLRNRATRAIALEPA